MGGFKHHEMSFHNEGKLCTSSSHLISNLHSGDAYGDCEYPWARFHQESACAFADITSFALYGAFIFFQTVSHRDYYLGVMRRLVRQEQIAYKAVWT